MCCQLTPETAQLLFLVGLFVFDFLCNMEYRYVNKEHDNQVQHNLKEKLRKKKRFFDNSHNIQLRIPMSKEPLSRHRVDLKLVT